MTPSAVIITVCSYLAAMFVLAYLSGRRAGNATFFSGNRSTSWYMAALAMISAAMSGVTFISVPGSVAADSFSYMQMVLGFTVGQFVVAFVLIPMFYRLKVVSLYEYLSARFGISSHKTGAWFFFISKMSGGALKIYVVCIVMQQLVFAPYGLPFIANVSLTMLLVWLYTVRGGVKSLIWTDALKTVCLITSLVMCIVFIMRGLNMSVSSMSSAISDSPYSQIFFFGDSASPRYFWKMFFAGIFILIAMTGLDQDMMQRNLSCRSTKDSQINIVITAFCQIAVIFLFLVLGVMLYTYMDVRGLDMPGKSDQVFSLVAVGGGLPLIVGVLFIIGLISSTYSAAGSALTALTTSFTVDILDGIGRFGERKLERVRKAVHVAMAFVMLAIIALFDSLGNDSIINMLFKIVGYTYGPILGMFAFGMLTHFRVRDRWMPLVAVVAPVLSYSIQTVASEYLGYSIGFELLIYNALLTMAGMLLIVKKDDEK